VMLIYYFIRFCPLSSISPSSADKQVIVYFISLSSLAYICPRLAVRLYLRFRIDHN
jgi:hypothetical protein